MAQKKYYGTLGVKRSETQSGIRKAYRELARKYHPDLNPGDKLAEERFKQIQEAYGVLGDPEKRSVYDRYGQGPGVGQGFQDPRGFAGANFERGGTGFRDIFSDLFGGKKSQTASRVRRGQDLKVQIRVPLISAIKGTQVRINATRKIVCLRCKGTGTTSTTKEQSCLHCGGSGQRISGAMNFPSPCSECQGRGRTRVGACSACSGEGLGQNVEALKVKIPPGVKSGSKVRVSGKGDADRFGGSPGDLFLVIDVQQHPFFQRQDNDILCAIPITVVEAALGAEIEVPTIDGKARLKIPLGTQSGQRFRLRGRGVPLVKSKGFGDQLVEVKIVLPTIKDERSKKILREFALLNPQNPRSEINSDPLKNEVKDPHKS